MGRCVSHDRGICKPDSDRHRDRRIDDVPQMTKLAQPAEATKRHASSRIVAG